MGLSVSWVTWLAVRVPAGTRASVAQSAISARQQSIIHVLHLNCYPVLSMTKRQRAGKWIKWTFLAVDCQLIKNVLLHRVMNRGHWQWSVMVCYMLICDGNLAVCLPSQWNGFISDTSVKDHEEIKSRLESVNACYHSVQNLLSSSLLSSNIKIKIYRTVILRIILHGSHWGWKRGWEFSWIGCWGGYFSPRRTSQQKGGEDYVTASLWSAVLAKYYSLGDQIKKNEMGGACGTYGGQGRCIQCFGGETSWKETTKKN